MGYKASLKISYFMEPGKSLTIPGDGDDSKMDTVIDQLNWNN